MAAGGVSKNASPQNRRIREGPSQRNPFESDEIVVLHSNNKNLLKEREVNKRKISDLERLLEEKERLAQAAK